MNVNREFSTCGAAPLVFDMPPPLDVAVLPRNRQPLIVGLVPLPSFDMPPPSFAVFVSNELLRTFGDAPLMLRMPPPAMSDVLSTNRQSSTVGLEPSLSMPPCAPPVIVKPSISVSLPSPRLQVTVVPLPPPSIVVVSKPFSLRIVMALPSVLMFSVYVPSDTMITSPPSAASIACWIVGKSPGTRMSAA